MRNLYFILTFLPSCFFGQLSGLVFDKSTGKTLQGVEVVTQKGFKTNTNEQGYFYLEAKDGQLPCKIYIKKPEYQTLDTTIKNWINDCRKNGANHRHYGK